jgi:predicted DNA-binding protein YlxM (UPF0122 family)
MDNILNQKSALHDSIMRCLEVIESTDERIMSHKNWESPDKLALLQFSELKERYTNELITLLAQAGVKVQLAQAA